MTINKALADTPVFLAVIVGMVILVRYHTRSRQATAFGFVSLFLLAALYAALQVHELFVPDPVHQSVMQMVYDVVLATCILLLVIGVVTGRDDRHSVRPPADEC